MEDPLVVFSSNLWPLGECNTMESTCSFGLLHYNIKDKEIYIYLYIMYMFGHEDMNYYMHYSFPTSSLCL